MSAASKNYVPTHKFDHGQEYRVEIEARTNAGETCEQIAAALRAQGVNITNKTISRRRVEWGLRKRPHSKLLGKRATGKRVKKVAGTKESEIVARKREIQARTLAGQSADEIARELEAQGWQLKKGASTVLRLQTQWKLIEPDEDRRRGKKTKKSELAEKEEAIKPKVRKEIEREANREQLMQAKTLHYPTNCSFGPKKRVLAGGGTVEQNDENGVMEDGDGWEDGDTFMGADDMNAGSLPNPFQTQPHQMEQPTVSVAAAVMSVEFLVDLANSTLQAAQGLRDSLQAYQARVPVAGSLTGYPPSLEDLSTARRKVRESAAVMHDLAAEPKAD